MVERANKQGITLWLMVGILLMTSALYLVNLNAVSFWQDESWMAIAISDGFFDVWTFTTEHNVHPPLYFYIAYFLQFAFGTSEFALRWMGGLISLIGIAVTYQLGRETLNHRTGVFTAGIAGGSFFLVYLSRLARHYTLFYTLCVAVVWLYWRWRKNPTNRRYLVGIAILQAAAFYTHYFSAFIGLSIGLHVLLVFIIEKISSDETSVNFSQGLQLAVALVVSGILFLPWLPSILIQRQGDLGDGVYYGVSGLANILDNFTGRMTNDSLWLGGAMTLAGIIGLIFQRQWRLALLLLIWIVGTFIPIVIINENIFQWYIGRNMLYTLPAIALLFGIGLAYVSQSRLGLAVSVATLISFVAFGVYVYEAYFPGTPDWRGILQRVSQDARPDDTFIFDGGDPYTVDYYLRRYLNKRIDFYDMVAWTENPTFSDRIWFIDEGMDVNHEALAVVSDSMVRTRRFFWSPIVADFWQTPPESPAVIYGEQMALGYLGDTVITAQAGDTLQVDVWWQALRVPDFNYSASFVLLGETGVIAQQDGNFDSGRVDAQVLPVGAWTPDVRILQIPETASEGQYQLLATVYDWRDSSRLDTVPITEDKLYRIASVIIQND